MEGLHPTMNGRAILQYTYSNGGSSHRRLLLSAASSRRRFAYRYYSVVFALLVAQNVLAEKMQSRKLASPVLQTVPCSMTGAVRCNSAQSSLLLSVLRGGSEESQGLAQAEEVVSNEDENVSTANSPTTSKLRSWFRVFQLRNEVQYDASRAPYVKKAVANNKNPTDSRGGAVVKQKPPRRSWMFSNNNNHAAVVPMAQSVRKVWWVNTWTDQLPSEEEERKAIELQQQAAVANNDTSVEGSTCTIEETVAENDADEPAKVEELKENAEQPSPVNDKEGKKPKYRRRGGRRNKSNEKQKMSPIQRIEEPAKPPVGVHVPTHDEEPVAVSVENVTTVTYPLMIPLPGLVGSQSRYCTSGPWSAIDQLCSIGLASSHPQLRLSSHLRPMRKLASRVTGLHGFLSGKPKKALVQASRMELIRRRQDAITKAKLEIATDSNQYQKRTFWRNKNRPTKGNIANYKFVLQKTLQDEFDENARSKRVKQIGEEMQEAGERLAQLACEKDVLQRRHNPLWKYAAEESIKQEDQTASSADIMTTRYFNFPSDDLVIEYLDVLFASGRLIRLNHTDLWRNANNDEQDEIDDEFLGPIPTEEKRRAEEDGGSAGSWLLRNGLGEKIGVTTERAAYKAVCKSLMSVLARSLSSLHGVSVMGHSDIRLTMEQTPSLPPLAGHIPGSEGSRNYAQDTIKDVMRRGARANRFRRPKDDFIQRAAVVETLLSQCQIAAPIMKLFPLAWQRAMLGNIVSMVTALISDFCEGIEFQILGHRLSISFTPITEEDMIQAMHSTVSNTPQPEDVEKFEAAVQATAEDVAEGLQFLDRWHERALGGGMLRTQIATLIARLVLTLVNDILVASKMDLWATQAGGPRLVAGLEYRSIPQQPMAGAQ